MDSLGAGFSILGAAMLACNKPHLAKFGWIAFLLANAFWVWYALGVNSLALLAQNGVFTLTSLYGLWNTRKA